MANIDPHCHCGEVETAVHLFAECPFARILLIWFFELLLSFDRHACFPCLRESICGYPKSAELPDGFTALLGIIRHRIWVARNAFRFDGVQPIPLLTVEQATSSFRFLLRIQSRHIPSSQFVKKWLAGGFFGHILDDNSILFAAALQSAWDQSTDH